MKVYIKKFRITEKKIEKYKILKRFIKKDLSNSQNKK